ncbi:MAG TPA: glycoside hydrolase family 2 protein [Bacteroidia bacterium]|nr:glycoside hydrolase family 2 protein [Bacteroidia bacterium]
MKIKTLQVVLLLLLFSSCAEKILHVVKRKELATEWQFSEKNKNNWLPASVPGDVHSDLLKSEKIPNPLFDNNESSLQWIGETDWTYKSVFYADDSLLQFKSIEFVFEGLDTYANVYLNDSLLLEAANMFRMWKADGKKFLKIGENNLRVEFYSPLRRGKQEMQKLSYKLPAPNDASKEQVSIFVRKAPYQFGWDWSPRFLTMGIWKPVTVRAHDKIYISDIFIKTIEIADTCAWLSADVTIQSAIDASNSTLTAGDGLKQFRLKKGTTTTQVKFKINQPELWWPNGFGGQKLYDVTAKLYVNGYLVDSIKDRTGIRTIELIREDDDWGKSFYFRINGLPVFMKGANIVPLSNFPSQNTKEQYLKIINDATDVGMNMLRVWGGGIYENNYFYDLCDEKGILIWQDFMFSCSMYPGDSAFVQNVRKEIDYQVRRLRNHPSLALWCGNNEIDVAWNNWGWQNEFKYSASDSSTIYTNYLNLFQKSIPDILQQLDPYRPYVPSSPVSNWGNHENFKSGDNHYWGVWHGEEDIDSFRVFVPRFMSEYGMQSYPSLSSLKKNVNAENITLNSSFIQNRQRSYKGNGLLLKYINSKFGEVKNVEDLSYLSQLNQAEAMRIAIESHRKDARFCMGSLYWQLNDVWDGASWSTVEHNGKWKAAHYHLKRLYARDILITETINDTTRVYIQSDNIEGIAGTLYVDVLDFKGRSIGTYQNDVFSGYLVAAKGFEMAVSDLLRKSKKEDFFLSIRLVFKGQPVAETIHYFVPPLQLNLPKPEIQQAITVTPTGTEIRINSNALVKNLYLEFENVDGTFSDNYFDLLPGQEKIIHFNPITTGVTEYKLIVKYFQK